MDREKIDGNFTPGYTPQLNGVAEKFNLTLQNKVRALLLDSGVPSNMWFLAAEVAVNMYNRTPHSSINFELPLNKLAPSEKSHFERIRRFGCVAYAYIPQPKKKFAPRAIKAIFVGYSTNSYVLWHPPTRKFIISRNVRFNENMVYKDVYRGKTLEAEDAELDFGNNLASNEGGSQAPCEIQPVPAQVPVQLKRKRGRPKKTGSEIEHVNEPPVKRKILPGRKAKEGRDFKIYARRVHDTSFAYFAAKELCLKKVMFNDFEADAPTSHSLEEDELKYVLLASVNKDPTSYREAKSSPEWPHWLQAIREELGSMEDNDVWDILNKSELEREGVKINEIDSKWVFKKKVGPDGKVIYKARLVIRGFKDRKEYELRETYAPVSRLPIVRAGLSIINKFDLHACQMDVKTAFLNGTLKNDIYMKIPDGIECDEVFRRTKTFKLKRALYGLKISSKRWSERFREEVYKLGFTCDTNEPCLYTMRILGLIVFIILYVDDMLIASNDLAKLNEIKSKLCEAFEMKDLGEPDVFLGMKISRDRKNKVITLNQTEYAKKILERFNLSDCTPHDTPMVTKKVKNQEARKLESLAEVEVPEIPKVPFREAIGSLMYLAMATRPDIAYAVSSLARRQLNPTEADWDEVKRVFRYLRGTLNLGLTYTSKENEMIVYTDTSLLDCEGSTSTSGYLIKIYGDTISWRSHKQTLVTRSSADAEYVALSESCSEIISLDKALRDITNTTFYTVTIWCDNKSAIDNSQKEGCHKLKHYDESLEVIKENLRHREKTGNRKLLSEAHGDFVKQCYNEGRIIVRKIPTKSNIADIFTKPLSRGQFRTLRLSLLN